MATDDEKPEPTVKQMLTAAPSTEDFARWFGLPSFIAAAEAGHAVAPPDETDPEIVAIRERRQRALANVDPALVEAMRLRNEVRPESLLKFTVAIAVGVDPSIAMFDETLSERKLAIGEPREFEIPDAVREDMQDAAPQALLRDLHRPEVDFDKVFEVADPLAELRSDPRSGATAAMATRWRMPPRGTPPFEEERRMLVEDRANRLQRPWTDLPIPQRQVTE